MVLATDVSLSMGAMGHDWLGERLLLRCLEFVVDQQNFVSHYGRQ